MNRPLLLARTATAFFHIVRDPQRLDVVFDLVDGLTADPKNAATFERLLERPEVAGAAGARLRLPELSIAELKKLPAGTFGEVAARFFEANALDPQALPRRETPSDAEWLSAHLYETHDLWHVATGFGPDVAGELGLQAFYAAQVEGPVALAILTAGMLNTLVFAQEETRARLDAVARGWQMAERAKSFVGVDWSLYFEVPLAEVRAELGIVVAPEHDAMRHLAAPAVSRDLAA